MRDTPRPSEAHLSGGEEGGEETEVGRPEELQAHDEDGHGSEGSQLEEVVYQLQQTEPVSNVTQGTGRNVYNKQNPSLMSLNEQVVMCTTNRTRL